MTAPRRAAAMASLAVAALLGPRTVAASDLEGGGRAFFVGPECRVRAEGPIACDEVTTIRHLVGEVAAVQLVVEAGPSPLRVHVDDAGIEVFEQLWVPVTRRSRGRDEREALPWAAAARPDDATILGRVAEPLVPHGGKARRSPWVELQPRERRAFWLRLGGASVASVAPIVEPAGGPRLAVDTIDVWLPRPVVSFFAYLERDELELAAAAPPTAGELDPPALQLADLLERHGVLPIDRAATVDELGLQLRMEHGPTTPRLVDRDLVVLGAYGTLGEPTDEAVARVVAMAEAVPPAVRDVVLYAIDEDCASDLGPRWRARLRAAGDRAARVEVLVTCSEDPRGRDVDVVMTTAERFDPALADRARAEGVEVWVYNGRLPQAGPMALDAPPESLVWNGWIAARYDVRRWFLWNVNHWSDRNRGGHGPRDVFADPETFHNADGDAVLYDGLLVFPPARSPAGGAPPSHQGPVALAGARLARLHRGIQDAALLAVAATIDLATARAALDRVVPRALGEVGDDERTPLGDGRAIAEARAMLHGAIATARAEGRLPSARATLQPQGGRAHPGLATIRADLALRAFVGAPRDGAPSPGRRAAIGGVAVAACLVAVVIAAARLGRRRRRR